MNRTGKCKACLWGMLILSLAVVRYSTAQPLLLPTETYSLDNGLADRLVTDVLLHSSGFIWIGTPSGINRFTGYSFNQVPGQGDTDQQLSDTEVEALHETADGRIAIEYRHNEQFFDILDPYTGRIQQVDLSIGSDVQGIARDLALDIHGRLFISSLSDEGIHFYQWDNGLKPVALYEEKRNSFASSISFLPLDEGGFLVDDGEKGFRWISADGQELQQFSAKDFSPALPPLTIWGGTTFMYQDRSGEVWLSLNKVSGLYRLDKTTLRWQLVPEIPIGRPIDQVWEDRKGMLVFAVGHGVGKPPHYESLVALQPNGTISDMSYLLSGLKGVFAMEGEDFLKTVFLGTGQGLRVVQNNRSKIKVQLSQPLSSSTGPVEIAGTCIDPFGRAYISTLGGQWYIYDQETDYLDTLSLIDPFSQASRKPECGGPMIWSQRSMIYSITCPDALNPALLEYDPVENSIREYDYFHSFVDLCEQDGMIWLLSNKGATGYSLVCFNPATGKFREFFNDQGINPIAGKTATCISAAGSGQLWVGTDRGLIEIIPSSFESQTYPVPAEKGLGDQDEILTLHYVADSLVWLGTANGLLKFKPGQGIDRRYKREHGLPHDKVFNIVKDDTGHYWLGTYYGIAYFNQDTDQFRSFFREDGLTSNEFRPHSSAVGSSGELYFGSPNGLNIFKPADLLRNDPSPMVALTKIERYNQRQGGLITRTAGLASIETLHISPYDSYFEIHFMLPDFVRPNKNQFITYLENYDKDWIRRGNTPMVSYTRLPAGHYTLHIKGAPPNGRFSEEAFTIDIKVGQIFYKTWWFVLLVLGIASGLVYLYMYSRLEQRLKVERLRTKLSSDLHDEMSGLLSGIAMQTDILQMQVQQSNIKDRLQRIGEVSRKAMSKMNDVIWSIDSRKDKMENLIERMREHADDILQPMEVYCTFELRRIDPAVKIPFDIRQELFFIFKEAINNVAKHAEARTVKVVLENTGKDFRLLVRDDGVGMHLPVNGKRGQGLTNLKMRAQRINAEIKFVNGQGFGVHLRMKKFA